MLQVCNQPIQLSAKNLHRLVKSLCPTSWDELEELFYCGYKDAKRFFTSEGVVCVCLCLDTHYYIVLYITDI